MISTTSIDIVRYEVYYRDGNTVRYGCAIYFFKDSPRDLLHRMKGLNPAVCCVFHSTTSGNIWR